MSPHVPVLKDGNYPINHVGQHRPHRHFDSRLGCRHMIVGRSATKITFVAGNQISWHRPRRVALTVTVMQNEPAVDAPVPVKLSAPVLDSTKQSATAVIVSPNTRGKI